MGQGRDGFLAFCAKCGSTEVVPWAGVPTFIEGRVKCRSCGTIGFPVEGTRTFIAEYQKHQKGKE